MTRLVVAVLIGLSLLAGCGKEEAPAPPKPAPPTAAEPPTPPKVGACYLLSFAEASQPTTTTTATPCRGRHTAHTFHVGRIDPIRDGHLLAVDSERVVAQVAKSCPARFGEYVGGDTETRRLSRFEAVWFAPTLQQSDDGETWFRCDVIALAGHERLLLLPTRTRGILDRDGILDEFGTCGTARPDRPSFVRVACKRPHRWRAVATVDLPRDARYGDGRVTSDADDTCRDIAGSRSEDPLKYEWSFEWPNRELWRSGQKWGWCWIPARG